MHLHLKSILIAMFLMAGTLFVDRVFLVPEYGSLTKKKEPEIVQLQLKVKGADGYTFDQPEYQRESVNVVLVLHESRKDLQETREKIEKNDIDKYVMAWSELKKTTCTIHVLDPNVKYEPMYIGHELFHCVYGQWHSKED